MTLASDIFQLGLGGPELRDGVVDPSAGAGVPAPTGSLYMRTDTPNVGLWQKFDTADTDWSVVSAPPAPIVRTWVFGQINQVIAAQGSATLTNNRLIRLMKNSLINVPGAFVAGSGDGVTGAMDGVDRWTTDASLNSPNAWLVIQFANQNNSQVLISPSGTGLLYALVWSPTGIFVGGSALADPTAADSQASGGGTFSDFILSAANSHYVLTVTYTNDGEQARVVALRAGAVVGFLMLGIFDETDASYPQPGCNFVGNKFIVAGSSAIYTVWASGASMRGYFGGSGFNALLTAERGTEIVNNQAAENTIGNRFPALPMNAGSTTGVLGYVGRVSQQLWAIAALNTGDVMVLEDSSRYAVFDQLSIPWDASEVWISDVDPGAPPLRSSALQTMNV